MNRPLLAAAAAAACVLAAPPARANDFPTADRVIYVQDCIKAHSQRPPFEMLNKCSCALDTMAREVRFDEYVEMTTVVNAVSIGGERGGNLRDNESIKPQIKRYRDLQSKVQKACLIDDK